LGYKIDTSSPGALMKSFDGITDPTALKLLKLLSFKATHRAKYFCAGMLDIAKYGHYALNIPLYTHFTSPIRRYADILVHRQLEAVLAGGCTCFHSLSLFEPMLNDTCSRHQVYHGSRRGGEGCSAMQHVSISAFAASS
jgi:exoribonuclease R